MCSPYPQVACSATVKSITQVSNEVFSLVLLREIDKMQGNNKDREIIPNPVPGQFFMLRARPSGVLLGRPISVYLFDDQTLTFLILKKGKGTSELCAVNKGQLVDVLGPVGNSFPNPDSVMVKEAISSRKSLSVNKNKALTIAVVGGGIGVAPVAGFAQTLDSGSFDFYGCFRSSLYGLEGLDIRAKKLVITTDDGSHGIRGMLSDVFNPDLYDLVYACGPTPMLKYLKDTCESSRRNPIVYLSLEQHMACGAGACLGCTIKTIHGNRRCCVDGPVFNAAEVIL